ncbi:MAG: hypothetical protein WAL47_15370 [Pyrinomonadaceae bacterium]
MLDGIEHRIKPGFAILVSAGTRHNIINGPSGPMKLYTLYAPPNHRDCVVHATKAVADADKEHFDGKTNTYSLRSNSWRSRLIISASFVSQASLVCGISRMRTASQTAPVGLTDTAALSHSGCSRSSAVIMHSSSVALFADF